MKRANPLLLLCVCVMFLMTQISYAQELAQPVLGFSYACASNTFNEFNIEVVSEVGGFNADNKFIIELSDNTGNFDTPVVLKEVSDKNNTLNFTTSFSFPNTTFGEYHTIRIRATSPERIGPESDVFSAYYISNTPLVLENYQDIFLCSDTSTTLTLETSQFTSFNWYLNGAYYATEGASLEVKTAGLYYAEVNFGVCSGGSAISNLVKVTIIDPLEIQINGDSIVALCSGDTYALTSSITDQSNEYYWYKDGNLITGISNKTISYEVSGDQMYADYTLKVISEKGCITISDPIEIINANTEFSVTAVGETENIIVFPGENTTIQINTTADATEVKWYKNEELLAVNTATVMQVSEEANYRAVVSVPGDPCGAEVSSPIFKVYNPNEYFLTLGSAGNYAECTTSSVLLQTVDIKYGISTGQKFVLDLDRYAMFNYMWLYNESPLSSANNSSLQVNNSELNGSYKLKIYDANTTMGVSNTFAVNLKLSDVSLLGDTQVYLCENDEHKIEASVQSMDYTYTWFKNDIKITSLPSYTPVYTVNTDVYGDYRVVIENQTGCTSISNTISLLSSSVSFNVIANDSDKPVILYTGETEIITISTSANDATIVWYKDGYEIPGSNSLSLAVSQPGKYRAKVEVIDTCGQSVYSDYINVITPQEYLVTIKTDANYEACYAEEVSLSIDELYIVIDGQDAIIVNSENYYKFTFAWLLDGEIIPSMDAVNLQLNSWEDSGVYQLKVSAKSGITTLSNERLIKMQLQEVEILSEAVNSTICEGESTRLYALEDASFTYQWYLNETPLAGETSYELTVNSSGEYYVRVAKNNCDINSNSIEVDLTGEESIQISPSDDIYITEGETENVVASGADSYQWQNELGEIISETATLVVSEEGVYAVIAKIGACEFIKTIEVSFKRSTLVPNIVSPNDDGVNDTWTLPQGYAFNEAVEIIIYNTNGVVVFATTNYQNNWPQGSLNNVASYTLFYYVIKQEGQVVKKGTITIIK